MLFFSINNITFLPIKKKSLVIISMTDLKKFRPKALLLLYYYYLSVCNFIITGQSNLVLGALVWFILLYALFQEIMGMETFILSI